MFYSRIHVDTLNCDGELSEDDWHAARFEERLDAAGRPGSPMTGFAVLVAVGCATGVTTVLFGFGGGFITVPAVFAAVTATTGTDAMHTAIATSTAIMIVNASLATLSSARQGRLRRRYLWPIAMFIAVGASLGAVAANWAPELLLHVGFIVYIGATIVDGVVRKGFLDSSAGPGEELPLGALTSTVGGVGIGAVASFLGIGGSVITVPLLRRRGVGMAEATATANPLSVPVAIAGTVVYALGAPAASHPYQVGFVSLSAGAALLAGSIPTIALMKRYLTARIPDRAHAIAYLVLLAITLIVMIAALVE